MNKAVTMYLSLREEDTSQKRKAIEPVRSDSLPFKKVKRSFQLKIVIKSN